MLDLYKILLATYFPNGVDVAFLIAFAAAIASMRLNMSDLRRGDPVGKKVCALLTWGV